MNRDQVAALKKGDLIFYVREIDTIDGDIELRVASRRVVGVTLARVTTVLERKGVRASGQEIWLKSRLHAYSLTPAAAKRAWEEHCQEELGTAERRVIRATEALGRAAEFSSRDKK